MRLEVRVNSWYGGHPRPCGNSKVMIRIVTKISGGEKDEAEWRR